MQLLTKEFLDNYPDAPEHMNQLAQFVFYRTYSRWLPDEGRRETFKEAIRRAVEYNVGISIQQFKDNNIPAPMEQIVSEAEVLFDNIFNTRQFLSGRTHWVGGSDTNVGSKFPLSNFNCAFEEINEWGDISELFYLLLVGTGVGIACTAEMAKNLPPIRRDYTLTHSEFRPMDKGERLENTEINIMSNGYAKIYVGDSKEGWVKALELFLQLITDSEYEDINNIKISYNSIRPRGERLKTFGGTASGYEPLRDMFQGIDDVFKDKLDTSIEPMEEIFVRYGGEDISTNQFHVRPIHILDIANLIGNNVVVGGVRRTAELFMCDADDWEVILAKYGINPIRSWDEHVAISKRLYAMDVLPDWFMDEEKMKERRKLGHRFMSNNSISFKEKPPKEMVDLVFAIMQETGEPGFVNLEAAQKRRPNAKGFNPCVEIILDDKSVCNLTTINMMGFIVDSEVGWVIDYPALMEAQALSVRAGMRMTCIDLELEGWNKVHKRDRLVGTSLTGWKDAMDAMGYDEDREIQLLQLLSETAHNEAVRYAYILRIPTPLLVTTVKPEGTLSQVAGGVSSGLHVSHAPYFIRRVRINANDPLATTAINLGWEVLPEVGTEGETYEDQMTNARTLVVEFPQKSPSTKTRDDQTLQEQFDTYFNFQKHYTAHNSSNTITVRDDEWQEASNIVYKNWDDFIGVAFIPFDGGSYKLAPYEEITKEEYENRISRMAPFSIDRLHEVEKFETEKDVENMQSCDTGICPIF